MEGNEMNVQTPAPGPDVDGVNWGREIFEWVVCIAVAVAIALLIKNFVFTLVKVDGDSMNPTLTDGDRLFTRVIGYTEPKEGDIIIFHPPVSAYSKKPDKKVAYVKRVIAVEGQTVDINSHGDVIVDDKVLKEDYISEKIDTKYLMSTEFPFTVPKDSVFVLGDNRNRSKDSRYIEVGAVPLDNIIGKSEFRLWPLGSFGGLY